MANRLSPAKNDYITIAPVTPKGKWTICMRRIGTKDRYAPVAEARTQTAADGIVDALNLMQGEIKKLEVPAQRLLEEVRALLHSERAITSQLRSDVNNLKRERDNEMRAHGQTKDQLVHSKNECNRIRSEFASYRDQQAVNRALPTQVMTMKAY
jgi:hypothetical protein